MLDSIMRITALARITVLDGIKRNAFIGMLFFALAGQLSGMLFFEFIPRGIGRAACDLTFSVSFLAGLLFILFHAVQVMAWDGNNKTLQIFLARPISRGEYLLGNFFGLGLLLLFLNILMAGVGWLVLTTIQERVGPAYFPYLSLTYYGFAFLGLYLIELTLLAIVVLFSSLVRGSFPVMLTTLAYYFICTGLPVVRDSVMQKFSGEESSFVVVFFKLLNGIFPDFSRLDFKAMAIDKTIIFEPGIHIGVVGISVVYIIIILWLAALVFKKKDIL